VDETGKSKKTGRTETGETEPFDGVIFEGEAVDLPDLPSDDEDDEDEERLEQLKLRQKARKDASALKAGDKKHKQLVKSQQDIASKLADPSLDPSKRAALVDKHTRILAELERMKE
jgi:hypothetical protein